MPVQGVVGPIAARSDGSKVFVSTDHGLLAIALSTFPPGTPGTLPSGSLPYADLVIDEAHNVLYGSNTSANKVDVISLSTQQIIGEIRFNNNTRPMGMDLKPDGSELAVALNGASSIAFVNTNTRAITATVIVDTDSYNVPFDVKYGRAGRLYSTSNPGSSGTGYLHILDTVNYNNVGRSVLIPDVLYFTPYLAISPDNNFIYAIDSVGPNRVCRYDISSDTIPASTCGVLYTYSNIGLSFILLKDGSKIFTGNGQVWLSNLTAQLGSFNFLGYLVEIPSRNVIAGISKTSPGTIVFIDKTNFYTDSTYTMLSPGTVGPSAINADGSKLFINTQSGVKAIDIGVTSPISITISSGSPQSAHVSAAFNNPLKAVVKNLLGNPLSGIEVTFTAPVSGASGTFVGSNSNTATALTDVNGIATAPTFNANNVGGTYSVTASVTNLPSPANFQLTNIPPSILVNSGSSQSSQVLNAFSDPLSVLVQYAPGEPIAGVAVTFTAPSSGASGVFTSTNSTIATAITDLNGVATSSVFTANNTAGSYTVRASIPNVSSMADLPLTNIASITCAIINGSGSNTLFRPYKQYNCGNKNAYGVGVGDFNGDGKRDVALSLATGVGSQNDVLVFLQDGNGNLSQPRAYVAGNLWLSGILIMMDLMILSLQIFMTTKLVFCCKKLVVF